MAMIEPLTLEAIAACLREEGLQAVAKHNHDGMRRINIVRPRTVLIAGTKVPTFDITHSIFVIDDRLVIHAGPNPTWVDESRYRSVELADPECFPKAKKVLATLT